MDRAYCQDAWLDATQALERLRELTGLSMGCRVLLNLCRAELCRVFVDCTFAHGVVGNEQLFVRRIRAIDSCLLLEGGELRESPGAEPGLVGSAVVSGAVWLYEDGQDRPTREEGIWRLNLGAIPRPLYFIADDLESLAVQIRERGERLRASR